MGKVTSVRPDSTGSYATMVYPNVYGGTLGGRRYTLNCSEDQLNAYIDGYVENLTVSLAVLTDELGRGVNATVTFNQDDIYMVYVDEEDTSLTQIIVDYGDKKVRRYLINLTFAQTLTACANALP
jgi:anionic cell wall polymer biosynthesis LytR-Cps2A-Psr (LCP) family protein